MMYSIEEKRKAIEREIALRKRVYPNRVETRRMTEQAANYQIHIFEEILEDYVKAEHKEQLF